MSPQLKTEAARRLRLTPEQLEDLRTVLDNFGRHSITSDMTTAAERLADALFPATEPAEETASSDGDCAAIGQAAVALRAALDVVDPLEDGDWEHAWRAVEDLEDCAKRAEAVTSIETEWPSLNDVPPTVRKVKDVKGFQWVRREGNSEWLGCDGSYAVCRIGHPNLAPFVVAGELDS